MNPHSHKSELEDRILWFDGDMSVSEEKLTHLIAEGQNLDHIFVVEMVPLIEQYNKFVPVEQQIQTKTELNDIVPIWYIPEHYKTLDVDEYVYRKLDEELERKGWNKPAYPSNVKKRVDEELETYKQLGLIDVLRTLIYIINTLQTNNVVWGVGRGSSVSSYVLYLIGVHDVDSVEYELEYTDFLRTSE